MRHTYGHGARRNRRSCIPFYDGGVLRKLDSDAHCYCGLHALVFEPVEEGELDVETCEPDAEKPAQTKDERIVSVAEKFGLTARETEVFTLWATGHGAKSIEEKLVLSSATVRTHIRHIYEKLDVHSRAELIELLESRQRNPRVEIHK